MTTPPSIPDHTLLRPIGRGAYGEVWLARNIMGALRAVKVIGRKQFDSDRPYEREFAGIQNYEPVSRSADGLVHVLHVGRNDTEGYFYYVMELADPANDECRMTNDGSASASASSFVIRHSDLYQPRTLRSDLKDHRRLPTSDCLRLALDVVSGLARLHQQGLVHRDVKPGNIIFVEGRAKLADLGLVSADGEGRTFVGTEGYIAPEGPGTPVADLYAFGLSLYEASTGLRPEKFPDVPPEWMTETNSSDALELHEVILKACEGQRERRYQNAEEMRADLALLQSGQSLRRVRALERRVKLARRSGLVAAGIALLAVVGVLIGGWRTRLAEQSRAKESALRMRAESAEREARQRLYAAYYEQARATIQTEEMGRRFRALEAIRQAAAIRVTPELRREALAALALPDLRIERDLDFGRAVTTARADPAFENYAVSLPFGSVEIRALSDQRLLQTLPVGTNLNSQALRFSPDGRYLAFKHDRGDAEEADLVVWDLAATQRVVFASNAVSWNSMSFHPSAPRLLAGGPDGQLVTWDLEHGKEVDRWPLPSPRALESSPDGTLVADSRSAAGAYKVEVRAATNGAVLATARFPGLVRSLAWHPGGRLLAVPCADGSVNLMDVPGGSVRVLGMHKAQASDVEFTPDGEFLFSGGWDGEINVWNVRTFQRELSAALGGPRIQFASGGAQAAVFVKSGRLRLLEFSRGAECRELPGEPGYGVRAGTFSADGRWLAIPTIEGCGVWDLARPAPVTVLNDAGIGGAVFNAADELFTHSDQKLFRYRIAPGTNQSAPPVVTPWPVLKLKPQVRAAEILVSQSTLLATSGDGLHFVPLTNVASGEGRLIKGSFWRVAVTADETRLAAASAKQPGLRLFHLPDMTLERTLTNAAPVRHLTFAANGRTLAVLTDQEVCLWDTTDWRITHTRPVTVESVSQLTSSPDGRVLLLRENSRTGTLLDARTLEVLLPFPLWNYPLALSADHRQLAVGVDGRRVRLWDFAAVRAHFRALGIDWEQ